jgi:hypothetical protein
MKAPRQHRKLQPESPAKPSRKARKDANDDEIAVTSQPKAAEQVVLPAKTRPKARSISRSRISVNSLNEQKNLYKMNKAPSQQTWMEYLFGPCFCCSKKK